VPNVLLPEQNRRGRIGRGSVPGMLVPQFHVIAARMGTHRDAGIQVLWFPPECRRYRQDHAAVDYEALKGQIARGGGLDHLNGSRLLQWASLWSNPGGPLTVAMISLNYDRVFLPSPIPL